MEQCGSERSRGQPVQQTDLNQKRTVYLEAEFPHKWPEIRKLVGGSTEYSEAAMRSVFGKDTVAP
jgi:hypothetical protein